MYTAKGQLDRDALFRQHLPLVRRIAHHMIAKLPPNVELDDLVQVGMIGLTDALSRYEAAQGVQFETFASQRIRGAMLDELRDGDWMSRGARKSQKEIEQALHRVEQRLGRSPMESEIGGEGEEGFLDRHVADEGADPMAVLRDQRLRASLVAAIKQLPEREQHIMGMYYEHDMNLKEIAAVLGVTESRVCQLHSQAIARLRTKMRAH